jgi:hypothetical protein
MSLKHNKKRNVGLVREFFTKFIAEATVNNKVSEIETAKNIWKKYFSKGTELHKEFNLFRALFETRLTNKEMAVDFINKVRQHSKNINVEKLNTEKTALIREVYSRLNDDKFFDRPIADYTDFATIQICLEYWANKQLSESVINPAIVELEDKIITHLTQPVVTKESKEAIKEEIQIDKIVLKIMMEKFNKKFLDSLSESQQKLIKLFAFDNNDEKLKTELKLVRENTLKIITKELTENKKLPASQKHKFETIKEMLNECKIPESNIDEDLVVFYMSVSKLFDEFTGD